ncbi:MAG TPA: YebC/PmpR family DNA-binding transcriptional regulator [Denitromonas sp.]|uniref:YebC/PmpR family DNA-binding transcriptional regulator n=1 Tax=Denitromonas sp. TaxID=2734609 RepID=UPI001D846B0D|nr:YebC/PmpR family DNA-binding transcriptional regulator [Rhodocyclaceae bacterium]MCP5223507.1 YebC/PmpR family DNA-binding transcriptional regulator [Zoogloeaceae bacterium]MCZ4304198.1 YebC/PmpR family DNA-binding transcriptional regulator [Zoogloeaceae bacterium G21618-S1]HPR05971.1 YebC/PmpR family DNA-binding transcriptional regulator [Denitromonas sp.]HQU87726.1 YebC/PmpR family DNA-binding transcriptional regulator [Denitromonas sp.]
MAGHSKWANIQHRKGRQDAKRGKVFTKLIKEVTVAAKMGGGDPASNPRLRMAIDKARGESMPKDNIENAIKRGTGQLEGVSYEEARYEGYGIGGAAVIVDCLTDNKVRTVADVRHAFSKYGGNLGTDGCVAFQFSHCGQLMFAPGVDEEALMDAALECGAEDVITDDDGSIEVVTSPADFSTVKDALEAAGFKAEFGEVTMKPMNETELTGDDEAKMQRLLDALDSLDDVQEVYTSAVFGD